jgi:hypothetical protein
MWWAYTWGGLIFGGLIVGGYGSCIPINPKLSYTPLPTLAQTVQGYYFRLVYFTTIFACLYSCKDESRLNLLHDVPVQLCFPSPVKPIEQRH